MAEDNIVLLTEHIKKLKANLAAAKDSYAEVKVELLGHAIVQDAMDNNERKAHEELAKEQTRSRSLPRTSKVSAMRKGRCHPSLREADRGLVG